MLGIESIWHWLIVLLVVVLVFGTKKLKNVGQDLGGAVRGFKEGLKGDEPANSEPERKAAAPDTAGRTIDHDRQP